MSEMTTSQLRHKLASTQGHVGQLTRQLGEARQRRVEEVLRRQVAEADNERLRARVVQLEACLADVCNQLEIGGVK